MGEQQSLSNPQLIDISSEVKIGCVKWFNNKVGYGFITYTDENACECEVFVHHSAINVKVEQYRYLVQGEYINFNLAKSSHKQYLINAANVRGINNGRLMCETRNNLKNSSSEKDQYTELDDADGFAVTHKGKHSTTETN